MSLYNEYIQAFWGYQIVEKVQFLKDDLSDPGKENDKMGIS